MLRKYNKIFEIGHKNSKLHLVPGDHIIIEEKINGSNASFIRIGNELFSYSRKEELTEENNLKGFYQFVKSLDPLQFPENIRYYGEWTCPQKVVIEYAPEFQNKFFLFDVFIGNGSLNPDRYDGDYQFREVVEETAKKYGFLLSPVLYKGPFISLEHLKSFVGMSELGATRGEGIIVKCHTFISRSDGKQKWGKIVTTEFSERIVKGPREKKPPTLEMEFVWESLNDVRVLKVIQKKIDSGHWDENYSVQDMGKIIPLIAKDLWEDFYEEEVQGEEQLDLDKVKAAFNATFPRILREIFVNQKL